VAWKRVRVSQLETGGRVTQAHLCTREARTLGLAATCGVKYGNRRYAAAQTGCTIKIV